MPSLSALERAEEERRERAARVCNATRTRVARGATVGPTDVEGWVVELALLRDATPTPTAWAGVGAFVTGGQADDGGRIVWTGAPELHDLTGAGTKVFVHERSWSGPARQFQELVLTFHGEYVLPYFRERERIRLIRLAHALATSENATLGALYGRCAEGSAHHMGSWFLGSSPGAATASLLYYMGAHAEPPHLPSELLSDSPGEALVPGYALTKLLELTRRLERQQVAALVGAHDGMVAGPAHFTTLGFPFVDSDRAWRASYKIVRALGH
jgi:serine/threonine-protein kinase